VRRFHPANLRAAWWALRTARRTRRLLDAKGLDAALDPPPPSALPAEAERGVRGALRRKGESCLVNSIVLQAWEAAHGRRRDLVVGITGPDGFRAHAWLQGDPVPTPDEAELNSAVFGTSPDDERTAPEDPSGARGDGQGILMPFTELLRRPAPRYPCGGSARVS